MEKWFVMRKGAPFQEIAEKFQIHPILARLIRNRDVIGDEADSIVSERHDRRFV